MKLNHKIINKAINDLCIMKIKLAKVDTMFIYEALDKALKKIGYTYADLCSAEKEDTNG
jgi:hypothetical protein